MNTDLACWQFATTSIYHFLFVPITIGLAFLVAILQTVWHRSGNAEYRRLTRAVATALLGGSDLESDKPTQGDDGP